MADLATKVLQLSPEQHEMLGHAIALAHAVHASIGGKGLGVAPGELHDALSHVDIFVQPGHGGKGWWSTLADTVEKGAHKLQSSDLVRGLEKRASDDTDDFDLFLEKKCNETIAMGIEAITWLKQELEIAMPGLSNHFWRSCTRIFFSVNYKFWLDRSGRISRGSRPLPLGTRQRGRPDKSVARRNRCRSL